MKKFLKISTSVVTAAALLVLSVFTIFAATYYTVDGYTYRGVTNDKIALYAWDNSSNTMVVPEKIGNKYFVMIDEYAFKRNTVIEYVDLSQTTSLVTLGRSCFESSALKSITIPKSVILIDNYAFQSCSALESIVINGKLTKINAQTFYDCASLSFVTLPNSLTSIESFAFASCPSLTRLDIPKSVTFIDETAFSDNTDLTLGVYYGTYAHTFALENDIPFVILDENSPGDVDSNGVVNINDATKIQRIIAEYNEPYSNTELLAGDINKNGYFDIDDVTAIQMYIAEYEDVVF